ncbi:helix-turn-helix domain-containing protein [Shinella yambaruensis]
MLFGRNLRQARKRGRIPQRELAELAGVSQSFISHAENGRASVSITKMALLSRALGVPLHELLKP